MEAEFLRTYFVQIIGLQLSANYHQSRTIKSTNANWDKGHRFLLMFLQKIFLNVLVWSKLDVTSILYCMVHQWQTLQSYRAYRTHLPELSCPLSELIIFVRCLKTSTGLWWATILTTRWLYLFTMYGQPAAQLISEHWLATRCLPDSFGRESSSSYWSYQSAFNLLSGTICHSIPALL